MFRYAVNCRAVLILLISFPFDFLAPHPTAASPEMAGPDLCEMAASIASRDSGVPLSVLRAIALTETGKSVDGEITPWPWTVNVKGAGTWFDDRASAETFINSKLNSGIESFDVGCFQINYRWHGHAFSSIEHMFEPLANAEYAASFLSELYIEFGDWTRAAGAYHSRTPKYARKYEARFTRFLKKMRDHEPPSRIAAQETVPANPVTPRSNRYPLLQKSPHSGAFASLVPSHAGNQNVPFLTVSERREKLR